VVVAGVSTVEEDATAAASTLAFFFFADLDSERTSGFWIAEVAIVPTRLKMEESRRAWGFVQIE
jgi:hypothetical protein